MPIRKTAFQEVRTSSLVADRLRSFGCDEVHAISGFGLWLMESSPSRSTRLRKLRQQRRQ